MKELKFNEEAELQNKINEIEMEDIELLEEKDEFWCIVNACGWNS